MRLNLTQKAKKILLLIPEGELVIATSNKKGAYVKLVTAGIGVKVDQPIELLSSLIEQAKR